VAKPGFIQHFRELSAPFLLSVSQAYLDAPVRVMFIGKETNGWCGKLGAFYERPDRIDIAKARYENQHARGTGNSELLRQWKRFVSSAASLFNVQHVPAPFPAYGRLANMTTRNRYVESRGASTTPQSPVHGP
jgi:hypothetical protein